MTGDGELKDEKLASEDSQEEPDATRREGALVEEGPTPAGAHVPDIEDAPDGGDIAPRSVPGSENHPGGYTGAVPSGQHGDTEDANADGHLDDE